MREEMHINVKRKKSNNKLMSEKENHNKCANNMCDSIEMKLLMVFDRLK